MRECEGPLSQITGYQGQQVVRSKCSIFYSVKNDCRTKCKHCISHATLLLIMYTFKERGVVRSECRPKLSVPHTPSVDFKGERRGEE